MRITLGKLKNKKIITGKLSNTRPTMSIVKEGIFNMVNVTDKYILDIFAGTGQLGFESLSLGATKIVLVDKDKNAVHYMKETTRSLDTDKIFIFNTDYRIALERTKDTFDVIFVDPPYKDKIFYSKSFNLINERSLLNDDGYIVSEINGKFMPKEYYEKYFNLYKEKNYGNTTISILKKK